MKLYGKQKRLTLHFVNSLKKNDFRTTETMHCLDSELNNSIEFLKNCHPNDRPIKGYFNHKEIVIHN